MYIRCLVFFVFFAAGLGHLQAKMIAYYPLDGDFEDALGDTEKTFSPLDEPTFVAGYRNLAASFDGINDAAVATSFMIDDFSIAFWVNTTDTYFGGYQKFWDGKGLVNADVAGCDQGDWGICLQDGNKAAFGVGAVCEDETAIRSATFINDGQWHFVCCTRDGYTGEFKIYVDEGPAENSDIYTPVLSREAVPMYLATVRNEEGKHLNGQLDELVFFDHVLSQAEIDCVREHGVYLPSKADLVAPDDGETNIPGQVYLKWTHRNVVDQYRVYLDTNSEIVSEPNLPYQPMILTGQEVWPASESDPNGTLFFEPVEVNSEYFWRVDSRVIEPNWSYLNPDTNEPYWDIYKWVEGDVWSFSGLPETVVFSISDDQYLLPDPTTHQMPVDSTLDISVHVLAARPIILFEWCRDGQSLWIDDVNYSVVTETGSAEISSVLTIHTAGEEDDGFYTVRVKLDTMEEYISPASGLYVSSELIVHRYSFDGNADDSIGDANGLIVDPCSPNITFDNGQVVFSGADGDGSNNTSNDPNAHFVDLPNGLISDLGNNMTLMVWFTWENSTAGFWQRVYDFGINTEGLEGQSTSGGNYLMLTAMNDSMPTPKMIFKSYFSEGGEALSAPPAPLNQEVCVAVTWSSEGNLMRLYNNGQAVDEEYLNGTLSDLDDRNNWLGRSQWSSDKLFIGRINEFRIYNVPLSEAWVKAFYLAGPDADPLNADLCLYENSADLNDDCVVDLADFAVFAENWIWCGLLSCQE